MPLLTEVELEKELELAETALKDIRIEIKFSQLELNKLQSILMERKEKQMVLAEKLRSYRLMYPDICKPPTK